MTDTLRILFIDDDSRNHDLWKEAIEEHNADAEVFGFNIDYSWSKSAEEAEMKLQKDRYDAAVVDLRLRGDGVVINEDEDGNHVVKSILSKQAMGIVIFSGQARDAADFQCGQIRIIDRSDGVHAVLEWIKSQSQILKSLRTVKENFEEQAARIFFSSIWPRWQAWAKSIDNPDVLTKLLSRHVIAHAHDAMLLVDGTQVHPEETYFVPPINSALNTGDLLFLENEAWIVVTPRCDMAHGNKVSKIVLAKCKNISEKWEASKKSNDAKKKIMQHEQSPKQHFLPALSHPDGRILGPWLAQFHDLETRESADAHKSLPPIRFASLAPQFIPSLSERFGAYFSRIGTPDVTYE